MSAGTTLIAVDRAPGELRAVALDAAGMLLDLAIERPGGPTDVGDLHRGRVAAHVSALAGAFIVLENTEGFLPDSAGGGGLTEGMSVAVRVVRAAQGGKGPRLAAATEAVAPGPPTRLARGPGAAARLAFLHPTAILREGWTDELAEQVAALAEPEVALRGGGRMTVTPTPALVAIDVDLGGGAAARAGKTRTHVQANTAWVSEVARQIRLRQLGGAILVDFAGLSVRRRGALGIPLAQALQSDPGKPRLLGFTALGFAEIVRPRGFAPLHETLAGPHAAALVAARALALRAAAEPAWRPELRGGVALIEAFARDAALQEDLRHRLGAVPRWRAEPALPGLRWELEA